MKRCPTCNRTYSDETITFCLDDGSLLSPSFDSEAITERYHPDATQRIPGRPTSPPPTEVFLNNQTPTEILPPQWSPAPSVERKSRAQLYVVSAVLVLLVAGGVFLAVKLSQKSPSSDSGSLSSSNSGVASSNVTAKPAESKAPGDYLHSPWLGLEVWQDGKASSLFKVDLYRTRVSLSSAPFEIRVPRLKGDDPPVLLTAWTTDKIFDQLKPGEKINEESESYFNPYKAMADTAAGSATLMLDDDAHAFYDEDRLKTVSDNQSTIYFSSVLEGDENERSLKDQKSKLYLVVFRDLNHNKTIDNGEYEFLILEFK
jgi:hypothetical protein